MLNQSSPPLLSLAPHIALFPAPRELAERQMPRAGQPCLQPSSSHGVGSGCGDTGPHPDLPTGTSGRRAWKLELTSSCPGSLPPGREHRAPPGSRPRAPEGARAGSGRRRAELRLSPTRRP